MKTETTYLPVTQSQVNSIQQLCLIVNDWAEKKGWNETPDSISYKAEQIALMHSELSECLEFVRTKVYEFCGKGGCDQKCEYKGLDLEDGYIWNCSIHGEHVGRNPAKLIASDDHVPALSGEAAELADVLIRIFHYCGRRGIDLGTALQLKHQYNIARPYRHGKNC